MRLDRSLRNNNEALLSWFQKMTTDSDELAKWVEKFASADDVARVPTTMHMQHHKRMKTGASASGVSASASAPGAAAAAQRLDDDSEADDTPQQSGR